MKRLIIFEGPDGVGKSTLAMAMAKHIGAIYMHHGVYANVERLHHVYLTAMAPATHNACDVVFDRSWLSEKPYGIVYRNGEDRIGDYAEELETYALDTLNPLVVRCDDEFPAIASRFMRRHADEYLETPEQLYDVWRWYRDEFNTALPQTTINPFAFAQDEAIRRILIYADS